MRIRDLIVRLLQQNGDLDDEVKVKLVIREPEGNSVVQIAILDIGYIDTHDRICAAANIIKWEPLDHTNDH